MKLRLTGRWGPCPTAVGAVGVVCFTLRACGGAELCGQNFAGARDYPETPAHTWRGHYR